MSQVTANSTNPADAMEAPVAKNVNLNRGKLGMICLICSEITFFGTLLATYMFYIGRDLEPPFAQDTLDISVAPMKVLFNSIFLLTSSIWIVLVGTGMEWYGMMVDDGLTIRTNLFGSTFYTVVGFHAGHVCGGLIVLTIVFILTMCGFMHKRHAHKVDMLSWYWHFVDGIWIAVFLIVYILGTA